MLYFIYQTTNLYTISITNRKRSTTIKKKDIYFISIFLKNYLF